MLWVMRMEGSIFSRLPGSGILPRLEILLIPVSMGTLTEAYRRKSQYGSQSLTRAKETRIVRNSDSPGSEFKLIAVWFKCTYFPESLWLETQRSDGPKRVRLLERDAL